MYYHVADCTTGEQGLMEMTPEEEAAHTALQERMSNQAAYEAHQREQAAEQRAAALATLTTHPDLPDAVRAALATLLGAGGAEPVGGVVR